jgi:hypothetical protein
VKASARELSRDLESQPPVRPAHQGDALLGRPWYIRLRHPMTLPSCLGSADIWHQLVVDGVRGEERVGTPSEDLPRTVPEPRSVDDDAILIDALVRP